MKKLSIIFLSLGIFMSCSKDVEQATDKPFKQVVLESFTDNPSLKTKETQAIVDNVTTYKDMLWFKDEDSYRKAEEVLSSFRDSEIARFNELYVTYTMEELAAMSEEDRDAFSDQIIETEKKTGFSEEGVYEQFENKLKFISLRSVMAAQVESFFSQTNPNWDNFPSHFIGYEPEQVLLNPHAEVRIGDVVYKFSEDAEYVITDANYATVLSLRKNINNAYQLNNVRLVEEEPVGGEKVSNSCAWNKDNVEYAFNDPNPSNATRRIKMVIGVTTSIVGKFWATTFNYMKNSSGNWVEYSDNCCSMLLGNQCYQNLEINPSYIQKCLFTKKVVQEFKRNSRANNGAAYSQHIGCNGEVEPYGFLSLSW